MFESIYSIVTSNIQKSLRKNSGWITDSVIDHNNNILNCNPLVGSSYTNLPKELDHPREGLANIQNIDDNECFKWCLVRYLHPADHNPRRITKANKDFAKKLDFKDIKFPVKIRDIQVIEKKNLTQLAFLVMKTRQNIQSVYQKNVVKKKTCWFITDRRRRQKALCSYHRF